MKPAVKQQYLNNNISISISNSIAGITASSALFTVSLIMMQRQNNRGNPNLYALMDIGNSTPRRDTLN